MFEEYYIYDNFLIVDQLKAFKDGKVNTNPNTIVVVIPRTHSEIPVRNPGA